MRSCKTRSRLCITVGLVGGVGGSCVFWRLGGVLDVRVGGVLCGGFGGRVVEVGRGGVWGGVVVGGGWGGGWEGGWEGGLEGGGGGGWGGGGGGGDGVSVGVGQSVELGGRCSMKNKSTT